MNRNLLNNHPCFNDEVRHKAARVHLPVAKKCNIQCNYCNRKYDCVNESRPGVTSTVISPYQALKYLEDLMTEMDNISVVGIAGPGDPFANSDETMDTLRLIREQYPDMILCVATNGLNISSYIAELKELDVSHITITLNTLDPIVGAQIYSWVRFNKKVYRGIEGASILMKEQMKAIKLLKDAGIIVKINTIVMPGINEHLITNLASELKELDVDIMNCMPLYKTEGSNFEHIDSPSHELMAQIKAGVNKHIKLMHHCQRCRADAAGIPGEEKMVDIVKKLKKISLMNLNPDEQRDYFAVASFEGVLVNMHLGEADSLMIYENCNGKIAKIGERETPEAGLGTKRWETLADILSDCHSIVISGIGETPRKILNNKGIKVYVVEGFIDEILSSIDTGKNIQHMMKRKTVCGAGCSGTGEGCG